MLVAQFWCNNSKKKVKKVIGVKSCSPEVSVNSKSVFHATSDEPYGGNMEKVFSVMSDATSMTMNTGKKTDINKTPPLILLKTLNLMHAL